MFCENVQRNEKSLWIQQAKDIDSAIIHNFYSKKYLLQLEAHCLSNKPYFQVADNKISHDSFDAILASASSAAAVAESLLNDKMAWSLARPPGHHASYEQAEGFCFINNVALAANIILQQKPNAKILIFDYDVHHGNGTQDLFYKNNQVFFASIHASPQFLYPNSGYEYEVGEAEGEGFTLNKCGNIHMQGRVWLETALSMVDEIEQQFKADYVLISAGFDAHKQDPSAIFDVQDEHFLKLQDRLIQYANKYSEGRVGSILEGGYSLEVLKRLIPKMILKMKDTK